MISLRSLFSQHAHNCFIYFVTRELRGCSIFLLTFNAMQCECMLSERTSMFEVLESRDIARAKHTTRNTQEDRAHHRQKPETRPPGTAHFFFFLCRMDCGARWELGLLHYVCRFVFSANFLGPKRGERLSAKFGQLEDYSVGQVWFCKNICQNTQ